MAEIRPLMVAEPMFRAPRPEMVAEVKDDGSSPELIVALNAAAITNGRSRMNGWELFGGWKLKHGIVDRDICLSFIDNYLLFVGIAFATGLDREGNKNIVDLLIVPEIGFLFDLCAVLDPLRQDPDFQKMIRIEVNVTNVAIFPDDL